MRSSVSVSYEERTSPSWTILGVATVPEHRVRLLPPLFRPSELPLRFVDAAAVVVARSAAAAAALAGAPDRDCCCPRLWEEEAICNISGLVPFVELAVEPHDDAAVGWSAPSTEVEGVDGVAFVESLGNEVEWDDDEAETALP